MPRKKSAEVEAVAPVQFSGYRRPHRLRWFSYDEYPGLNEGEMPLKINVPVNLSFAELQAITDQSAAAQTYEAAFKAIAPYVVEWNVTAIVQESGELEAVPPPAEAGWEVFQVLDHVAAHWVIDKVKFGYLSLIDEATQVQAKVKEILEEARKKGSAESAPSDETPSDDDSASAA